MQFKEKNFTIVLIFAVLVIVGLYFYQFSERVKEVEKLEQKMTRVKVYEAYPSDFIKKINVFAKLYSEKEITILAEVDGTISEKKFPIGTKVYKDDLIITMTDTRKLLQLKESKDSLSAFKAILDEETRNYKNAISLFEKDIISRNELKSKENLYRKAKSEYDNREAIYKRILWEFDNLNVKAPFDGYINKFYFDEGQKILAGQKIVQFSSFNKLIGRVSLKSEDIKKIDSSLKDIKVNHNNEVFFAKFLGLSKELNKDIYSYLLEFEIINDDEKFLPGEVVDVEIDVEELLNYIIFPSKAIINENDTFYIFYYANGYAFKKVINPVWIDEEQCAILNSEDYSELKIIYEGQSTLEDNQPVELLN